MIFSIIKQHIYLYLLILTTIEGPITTFVSAGFAAHGILRIEYVAIIAFMGDVIGDVGLYIIGRIFGKIAFLKKFRLFSRQEGFLKKTLDKSPFLYFMIVKFTPYLSSPSLIFAGAKKMKFHIFLLYSLIVSIFVKLIYITLGYLGSFSVGQVERFLSGWKQIVLYILIGIGLFMLTNYIYMHLGKHIRKDMGMEIEEKNE